MTRCSFCNHPLRETYERKIASKELTMTEAAQKMNSNKATISRHMRNCFPRKIAEWIKPEATKEETLNVINALTTSHGTTVRILQDALAEGDRRTALLALQTEIKQLELTAKLTGQTSDRTEINLLLTPEFQAIQQVVVTLLDPAARLQLNDALAQLRQEARSSDIACDVVPTQRDVL